MIKKFSLQNFALAQNETIGCLAIHSFAKNYTEAQSDIHGAPLPLVFTVLPIVFNLRTVNALFNLRSKDGLMRAISEDRTIVLGLQERMQDMAPRTYASIGLGLSTGLVVQSSDYSEIFPGTEKPPKLHAGANKEMLATASRLGTWYASMGFDQVCLTLGLRF